MGNIKYIEYIEYILYLKISGSGGNEEMTSVLKPPLSKKLRTPVFILRSEWLTVRVRDSVIGVHATLYHKDKKSKKMPLIEGFGCLELCLYGIL